MPTAKKTRSARKSQTQTPADKISELPSSIIENILMCLPIRDAARTSILSRKWRYSWCRIPQLVLDETISRNPPTQDLRKRKLVEVLFQILSLHQGPILKFDLTMPGLEGCTEIDNLIVLLSRSGVQEFTLKTRILNHHYRMPSSFFSCNSLRSINLRGCSIAPPPSFNGFNQVVSMCLSEVAISAKALGSLVANCPILENLMLKLSHDLSYLEIEAPKLKSFLLRSPIKCVFFKNTPILFKVWVFLESLVKDEIFGRSSTVKSLNEYFRGLPSLEILQMDYYFIKSLCIGGVPAKVTAHLTRLKYLTLTGIALEVESELNFLICILGSSPNLVDIEISVCNVLNVIEKIPNVQDYSSITLDKLQNVKLEYIAGTWLQMDLIKLLLERSPRLEKMVIQPEVNDEDKYCETAILKELTKFRRASPLAEVIYEDPVEEDLVDE